MEGSEECEAKDPDGSRWSRITLVLLVIAVVIMIFMCSFVALFLNPLLEDVEERPRVGLRTSAFINPSEATTTNGGGWEVRVTDVTAPRPDLSEAVLTLHDACPSGTVPWQGSPLLNITWGREGDFNISHTGSDRPHYYVHNGSAGPPVIAVQGRPRLLENSTDLDFEEQLRTVENASLVYLDHDGDGLLSLQDSIMIYSDIDGDGVAEIEPETCLTVGTTDTVVLDRTALH